MGLVLAKLKLFAGNFWIFEGVGPANLSFGLKAQAADTPAFRLADDSGFAVLRTADPVGDNDVVTKGWLASNGPAGVVKSIGIQPGTSTANSTAIVPVGRVMSRLTVVVTTPYSVGATIAISAGGVTLAAAGVINAQVAATTSYDFVIPATANGALTCTVAGAPVAGACVCYLEHSSPAS